MMTLDHAGTAGPDTLAASGRFPAGPPAPFAPPEQGPARARGRLAGMDAAGGLVGAVLGYGGSWFAVDVLGGRQALLNAVAPVAGKLAVPADQVLELLSGSWYDTVPTTTPGWLLSVTPHSGSPFDVVGAGGIAVAVLGMCLLTARGLPWLIVPLTATEALALTLYAGHISVLALVQDTTAAIAAHPWPVTAVVVVGAVLAATGWRNPVGRGSLEALLHTTSARAGGAR